MLILFQYRKGHIQIQPSKRAVNYAFIFNNIPQVRLSTLLTVSEAYSFIISLPKVNTVLLLSFIRYSSICMFFGTNRIDIF